MLRIERDVPLVETRGRKSGVPNRNAEAKASAIAKGVAMVQAGETATSAARMIEADYPRRNVGIKHLARLITEAAKQPTTTA